MNMKLNKESTLPSRVVIEKVYPEIDGGMYPIKRIAGEKVHVSATVFGDGHDEVVALLLYRKKSETKWQEIMMTPLINDRWEEAFLIEENVDYFYTIEGQIDHFITWKNALKKRLEAKQDLRIEILTGVQLLEAAAGRSDGKDKINLHQYIKIFKSNDMSVAIEAALSEDLSKLMSLHPDKKRSTVYPKELRVCVERGRALFSTWYELFPRSWSKTLGQHGTFKDVETMLPDIERMGFDVLYLPPIHPIGKKNRKGKKQLGRLYG